MGRGLAVTGSVADSHCARASRDLHIAASPNDATRGTLPCGDDKLHYIDPCSGWRALHLMLCSA